MMFSATSTLFASAVPPLNLEVQARSRWNEYYRDRLIGWTAGQLSIGDRFGSLSRENVRNSWCGGVNWHRSSSRRFLVGALIFY